MYQSFEDGDSESFKYEIISIFERKLIWLTEAQEDATAVSHNDKSYEKI